MSLHEFRLGSVNVPFSVDRNETQGIAVDLGIVSGHRKIIHVDSSKLYEAYKTTTEHTIKGWFEDIFARISLFFTFGTQDANKFFEYWGVIGAESDRIFTTELIGETAQAAAGTTAVARQLGVGASRQSLSQAPAQQSSPPPSTFNQDAAIFLPAAGNLDQQQSTMMTGKGVVPVVSLGKKEPTFTSSGSSSHREVEPAITQQQEVPTGSDSNFFFDTRKLLDEPQQGRGGQKAIIDEDFFKDLAEAQGEKVAPETKHAEGGQRLDTAPAQADQEGQAPLDEKPTANAAAAAAAGSPEGESGPELGEDEGAEKKWDRLLTQNGGSNLSVDQLRERLLSFCEEIKGIAKKRIPEFSYKIVEGVLNEIKEEVESKNTALQVRKTFENNKEKLSRIIGDEVLNEAVNIAATTPQQGVQRQLKPLIPRKKVDTSGLKGWKPLEKDSLESGSRVPRETKTFGQQVTQQEQLKTPKTPTTSEPSLKSSLSKADQRRLRQDEQEALIKAEEEAHARLFKEEEAELKGIKGAIGKAVEVGGQVENSAEALGKTYEAEDQVEKSYAELKKAYQELKTEWSEAFTETFERNPDARMFEMEGRVTKNDLNIPTGSDYDAVRQAKDAYVKARIAHEDAIIQFRVDPAKVTREDAEHAIEVVAKRLGLESEIKKGSPEYYADFLMEHVKNKGRQALWAEGAKPEEVLAFGQLKAYDERSTLIGKQFKEALGDFRKYLGQETPKYEREYELLPVQYYVTEARKLISDPRILNEKYPHGMSEADHQGLRSAFDRLADLILQHKAQFVPRGRTVSRGLFSGMIERKRAASAMPKVESGEFAGIAELAEETAAAIESKAKAKAEAQKLVGLSHRLSERAKGLEDLFKEQAGQLIERQVRQPIKEQPGQFEIRKKVIRPHQDEVLKSSFAILQDERATFSQKKEAFEKLSNRLKEIIVGKLDITDENRTKLLELDQRAQSLFELWEEVEGASNYEKSLYQDVKSTGQNFKSLSRRLDQAVSELEDAMIESSLSVFTEYSQEQTLKEKAAHVAAWLEAIEKTAGDTRFVIPPTISDKMKALKRINDEFK